MKERPILFSGPMVRAINEGRKSQTRRVMKLNPAYVECHKNAPAEDWAKDCPHGQRGDLLWVREGFLVQPELWSTSRGPQPLHYRADTKDLREVEDYVPKPSIHMPRWASRLTLRITTVRVERLQEITGQDCAAEGVQIPCSAPGHPLLRLTGHVLPSRFTWKHPDDWSVDDWFRFEYAEIWEQINGRVSWTANPWVWVIEFERIEQQQVAA